MTTPFLDSWLDREAAAKWLGISEMELLQKSRGLHPMIPPFAAGKKTLRWNPRTVIAASMARAQVPENIIAASFGTTIEVAPE